MKQHLTPAFKTLSIMAVGIGLVSLALSANPGQAELDSQTALDTAPDLVFAQAPGPGGLQMDPGERWLDQLNLSADQLQQIQAIREQYKSQMEANRTDVQTSREDLRQLMAGTASDNELRQKHNELQNLMQQGGDLRFESMLAIRGVLTPEQRQQAAALMEQHQERMHDRWENRQNNGNADGLGRGRFRNNR
ncbi:MAG: Spy/CpxP family protein refolding chaperone [Prochlorotrichaceae cyanobacterium]|jgi:Spy/CpxP family protein refolding chaperone